MLHPTEKYYPLRPELAESTFYLYQATKGLFFSFLTLTTTVVMLLAGFTCYRFWLFHLRYRYEVRASFLMAPLA